MPINMKTHKQSLPLRGKQSLPLRGKQSLPLRGKNVKKKMIKLGLLLAGIVTLTGIIFLVKLNQTPKTPYPLPLYDNIHWSSEKSSSVYALLSPDTADEEIKYTQGTEITGEDTEGNPKELYSFYDNALTKDGFEKINVVGDPGENTYWVASYKKNRYYIEVQYYVTPEDRDTRTSMLFSGILPN
jgi:hypothetical protein